jgi:hypothetical protein
MAGLSIYGRSQILAAVFARDLFNSTANFYLALTGVPPMPGHTAAHLDEPTDAAYARQPYGHTSAYWAASGLGTLANAQTITFPAATVDWGLIAGWALCDAASGDGNLWLVGEMAMPARVIVGSPPVTAEIGTLQLVGL